MSVMMHSAASDNPHLSTGQTSIHTSNSSSSFKSRDHSSSTPMPALTTLLQTKNLEMIEHKLQALLDFTKHFPDHQALGSSPITNHDLSAMRRLSDDISAGLGEIVALHKDIPNVQEETTGGSQHCLVAAEPPRKRRRRSSKHHKVACHECQTETTPQWRNGPNGPGTLCNVCGLIFAKRQNRYAARLAELQYREFR